MHNKDYCTQGGPGLKITVLNGSPKGDTSVTMQYVHYIHKMFPDNSLTIHNISQRIKAIEKDARAFDEIIKDVKSSELVIWAFPLFYLLVPSQYKRFIELIFERKAAGSFSSKYAAVITTSIHFFDHTAHNYMRAICDDLGMKFAGAYSAAMYDLVKSKERSRFTTFAELVFNAVKNNRPASRAYRPVSRKKFVYKPSMAGKKVNPGDTKILILTDAKGGSSNQAAMVERLKSSFSVKPMVVNLYDIDIKGGCLGCLQCGYDNQCVYGDSDGYHEFFETTIKTADILFYCGDIRDRYFSSKWKQFLDRSFYNNHTPVLTGKQIGYLVSGPLSELASLRESIQVFPEFQQGNLVDIVSDECGDSRDLDFQILTMASRAVEFAEKKYMMPQTFPSVGGHKIFRDEIWSGLRFPFIADHTYYKKHGMYDFPQSRKKQRIISAILMTLAKIPGFRNEIYKKRMKDEMIKPLQSVLRD
jgi:multimeric flavodoxin WrbA